MRTERYTRTLDELETDLIVTTLFKTERPPQGVGGLVDWRLNGFVSRSILSGTVAGDSNEMVLIPLHRRLPARRLLVLGMGTPAEFRLADARHMAHRLGKTIAGLGAVDVAVHFPAAADERVPGETEKAVLDTLEQCELPRQLILRWLAPS
jgi:hypothetical protein